MPKQAAPLWFIEAVQQVLSDPKSVAVEPALRVAVGLAHLYAHAARAGLDLRPDALEAHIRVLDALSELPLLGAHVPDMGDVDSRLILAGLAATWITGTQAPKHDDGRPRGNRSIKLGEDVFRSQRQILRPTGADFRKLMGGVKRADKRTKGPAREAKLAFRLWPAFPTLLGCITHARIQKATSESIQALWMEGATVLMLLFPGEKGSELLERVVHFSMREKLRKLTLARLHQRRSPIRGYTPRCDSPCFDKAMMCAFGYVRRTVIRESYRAEGEEKEGQLNPRTRRRYEKQGALQSGEVPDKDRLETIKEEQLRRAQHQTLGFHTQAGAAKVLGVSRAKLQTAMRRAREMGQVYRQSKKTNAYLISDSQLQFLSSILVGGRPIVSEGQDEAETELIDETKAEIATEFASFMRNPWTGLPLGD